MALYRYWRLSGLTVPSDYLEIGEFQFVGQYGPRLIGATLTSALPMWGGTVEQLNDGSLGTAPSWTQANAQHPDWAVIWDFGAQVNAVGCWFFGYDNSSRYISAFSIHASNDGSAWDLIGSYTATYPGNFTSTPLFQWGSFVLSSVTVFTDLQQLARRAPLDFAGQPPVVLSGMSEAIKPLAHGPGRVAGTLKVLSAPAARAVRLHDRRTGQLLRHTVSASNGTYSFESLQLGRPYLVVGLDDTGQPAMYNAAVADMVEAGQ